jgi:LysR family cyn operon transcriptional activator
MEMSQDEVEAGVIRDDIDVGIAFSNTQLHEARSNDIESHVLCIESLNLAVGEGHHLAGRTVPLSGEELGRETMVLLNTHFALRRHFDMYCLEHGISPRIAIESNSVSVIVEILRLGRHVTVLPNTIALAQPGLHPVQVKPELPNHSITLISRKGAYKSQACRAFGNMAAEFAASCANRTPAPKVRPGNVPDAGHPKERKFSTGQV